MSGTQVKEDTTELLEGGIYNGILKRHLSEEGILVAEMRSAILNNEFELYYQPQNSAENGELVGFEALVRWKSPTKGVISPITFIPLAEKSGLINQLGEWVINESCKHAANWDDRITVSVNVSAVQITGSDLPNIIRSALRKSGLSAKRLELEITESALIVDEAYAVNMFNEIKEIGCSIVMDDFGTGYSSLARLSSYPFDKIKIDRAFIMKLHDSRSARVIVESAVLIGASMGMRVLAEGVETKEDFEMLQDLGCHELQGYYFGRPAPYIDVSEVIAADVREKRSSSINLRLVKSSS